MFTLLAHVPREKLLKLEDLPAISAIGRKKASLSDLHVVEAFCRAGTLRGAAKALHLHHSSVAKRIENVESILGYRLSDPIPRGSAYAAVLAWRLLNRPSEAMVRSEDAPHQGYGYPPAVALRDEGKEPVDGHLQRHQNAEPSRATADYLAKHGHAFPAEIEAALDESVGITTDSSCADMLQDQPWSENARGGVFRFRSGGNLPKLGVQPIGSVLALTPEDQEAAGDPEWHGELRLVSSQPGLSCL
jgi:hypothetical protein